MNNGLSKQSLPLGVRASFGALPPLAGKFSGPAIVLGRALGWQDELDTAFELTGHDAPVFAVNHHMPSHYGCIAFEHVVSIHSGDFPPKDKRRQDVLYHAEKPLHCAPNADVFWPIPGMGAGSSALLATVVALNMGYAPVYLAGVHLAESTSVDDGQGHCTIHSYCVYQDGWTSLRDELMGRVFSVSPTGTFIRDLLGGA